MCRTNERHRVMPPKQSKATQSKAKEAGEVACMSVDAHSERQTNRTNDRKTQKFNTEKRKKGRKKHRNRTKQNKAKRNLAIIAYSINFKRRLHAQAAATAARTESLNQYLSFAQNAPFGTLTLLCCAFIARPVACLHIVTCRMTDG
eukprot:TRINITY_DN12736_c0_g1_i5.p1 TRINITY_DN12736_c0_g1~~TRINITY_DN12736_c0_g1_i5.p1  ORF type:complete len:146 (+),score=17.36 TRINITY_DN12736_c0_g1_i5:184-621(+)